MARKLFGTDGIRGIPNTEPLTIENVMELGRSVAHMLKGEARAGRRGRILIGRDTRGSGYMLENALCAGISSVGLDTLAVGDLPTPAIAFLSSDMRADAGIVISASHNPFKDNGIKIFDRDGFKLKDDIEENIEKYMFSDELKSMLATPENLGKVKYISDAKSRYIVFAKKSFPGNLTLKGLRIVLDCANGAAHEVGPTIFDELGAEVIATGNQPDGININEGCGALHPENIVDKVKKYRADLGISLDGDADRVILVDEKGRVVDGDITMCMLAKYLKSVNLLKKNTMVVTPMSNFGLEIAMKDLDITLVKTAVGDRYVVEMMRNEGYNFGGEQSGHIIFLDYATTGDGIVAALQVLSLMVSSGKPLSELAKVMKKFPQVLINIPVKEKPEIDKIPGFKKSADAIKAKLGDRGRLFVRYSGTEAIARVMIEGENELTIEAYAEELAEIIRKEIGA